MTGEAEACRSDAATWPVDKGIVFFCAYVLVLVTAAIVV